MTRLRAYAEILRQAWALWRGFRRFDRETYRVWREHVEGGSGKIPIDNGLLR